MDDGTGIGRYEIFKTTIGEKEKGACCIVDVETYQLLHLTESGMELYQVHSAEDYIGKKCYQVLQGRDSPCPFCVNGRTSPDEWYKWEYYNQKLKRWLEVEDMLIQIEGRECRLERVKDITNRREMVRRLSDQLSMEDVLLECIQILATEEDSEQAFRRFLERLGRFYRAGRTYIIEFDLEKQTMHNTYEWCAPGVPSKQKLFQGMPVCNLEQLLEKFRRDGEFYLAPQTGEGQPDPAEARLLDCLGIKSLMAAPLHSDGVVVGFIGVDDPTCKPGNLKLLRASANFVIEEIRKSRLIRKLQYASYTDLLTGLNNRNKYTDLLASYGKSAPESLGVVFADLNGMKSINDTYGHKFGDQLLIQLAEILKRFGEDNVYRVGGDEFVAIYEGITEQGFADRVAALRQAIRETPGCSVSLGSSWGCGKINVGQLVASADQQMYVEKQFYYQNRQREQAVNRPQGRTANGREYTCYLADTHIPFHQAFFTQANERLSRLEEPSCLVAIDVNHFKLVNELYGKGTGNRLLRGIEQVLQKTEGLAGYMGNDEFALLCPDREALLAQLQKELDNVVDSICRDAGFACYLGIRGVEEGETDSSALYDQALLAMLSTKDSYVTRAARFDRTLARKMEEEHFLLSDAVRALEQGEFLIYLQPQLDIATNKVVGYEALVRWNRPGQEVIPPDRFIPALEKNGLITYLDQQVWERVAALQSSLQKQGRQAVPISVNVSRVDFYAIDVVQNFIEITRKYQIEPRLLEVEITESVYAENEKKIAEDVHRFHQAGFLVLMDDFGSGYSSLNMLKTVNVDILKIDMKFLDVEQGGMKRTVGILDAIARMARVMNLRFIAEGIETEQQLDYLKSIGCRYGQRYYYSRPIEAAQAIVQFGAEGRYSYDGIRLPDSPTLQVEDLLHGDLLSDWLLEKILGGIAIYARSEKGTVELLRANPEYYQIVRISAERGLSRRNVGDWIFYGDKGVFREVFDRAAQNRSAGAQANLRCMCGDGVLIWIQLRVFFVKKYESRDIFCATIAELNTVFNPMEQQYQLPPAKAGTDDGAEL